MLWYDGSSSETNSNDISKFGTFEEDLRPTDIVVHRAGLEMRLSETASGSPAGPHQFVEFNEMRSFEQPYDLRPRKVGIVQTVDARERVATILWYQEPNLLLLDNGASLSGSSLFGPMGNTTEDMSMYEIMKFPALHRDLRNMVIVHPQHLSRRVYDIIQAGEGQRSWRSLLSWATGENDATAMFHMAREHARLRGILRPSETRNGQNGPTYEARTDDVDWVGEIVALGLDGSVTVRLSGATHCRDVIVSFDEALAIIDLDNLAMEDGNEDVSVDLDMDDASDASTISESIEYEGGRRMDNDEDDENWESAEEDIVNFNGDADMTDASDSIEPPLSTRQPRRPDLRPASSGTNSFYHLLGRPIRDCACVLRRPRHSTTARPTSAVKPPATDLLSISQTHALRTQNSLNIAPILDLRQDI